MAIKHHKVRGIEIVTACNFLQTATLKDMNELPPDKDDEALLNEIELAMDGLRVLVRSYLKYARSE